jgi:aminoglycoside phosphotransferase (APT) family kinase protein
MHRFRARSMTWALASAPVTRPPPDPERLAAVVAPVLGRGTIAALRRLSGGASRETWSFDLVSGEHTHPLILRRDPGSAVVGATERATEFALLGAAEAAGVPVPRVRVLLGPDDGLGTGFVMDRVDGETIPRRILRDDEYAPARPRLAAQCGEIAARIHLIDPAALPELPVADAGTQLAQYTQVLDTLDEPHPALELGLRWLAQHAPASPANAALVHGDFRNGNFVVGPQGVRAVLDWELAHLGDPAEDLGWLCVRSWRFGVADKVVGGFGDLDELLGAYREAGGDDIDAERVRYWTAFGTLKWGVICIAQAYAHLHGLQRSVELATLGRRVAETEWDLLDILDGGW